VARDQVDRSGHVPDLLLVRLAYDLGQLRQANSQEFARRVEPSVRKYLLVLLDSTCQVRVPAHLSPRPV